MNLNTSSHHHPNAMSNEESKLQLQEYLIKLIELVPDLKHQQQLQALSHRGSTTESGEQKDNDSLNTSFNCLEQLGNLDLNNSKEISDLQILQSVLDYIVDLKTKILPDQQSS